MRYSPFTQRIDGTGAAAWEIHTAALSAQHAGEDVIVMSVGDPDFATPSAITDSAIAALRAGDTHYTAIPGRSQLRELIAREHQRRSGQEIGPENTIVMAGAQCALFATSLCLASAGDEVIALEPMYVTYEASIQASGATIVPIAQPATLGFRPDLDALEAAVTSRTRAIFLTTPNNPTGVVLREDELRRIAGIAQRHDLWVVADEVYADLIFEGAHCSIAALPGMAERTVTISSLSKSHAMTGWRMGWAVGPETLIGHLNKLSLCMLYGLPGFVQEAAITALRSPEESQRMREVYRQRRDLVLAELEAVEGLQCLRPQAGMFLMIDIRETGLSASEFAWALYRETGVSVLAAEAFGPSGAGYIRLSFTLGEEKLREGCRRIADFMARQARQRATA